MSTLSITNWDASTMTAKLDGIFYLIGVQSINMGDGLEVGKQVNQTGQLGPMGFTKPLFKGDGNFSIKMLAQAGQMMEQYLLGRTVTSLGLPASDGIYNYKTNLKVTFNLNTDLFEIEMQNVQFLPPTFSGIDAADSREPLVAEYKFTCTNRIRNAVPDWNLNIYGVPLI